MPPSRALLLAGEEQSLKMLPFSNQVFAIILTPKFQTWQSLWQWVVSRGPLPKRKEWFFPFSVGSPHSSPPGEGEGLPHFWHYRSRSVFPFPQKLCFHCKCSGHLSSCFPGGVFIWSPGRQRVGGGRDPRDPGLGVAQLHAVWGRRCSQDWLGELRSGVWMISLVIFLLLTACAVQLGCFTVDVSSTGSILRV